MNKFGQVVMSGKALLEHVVFGVLQEHKSSQKSFRN